ncbi:MAG: ABC-2 family transporter protein [Clostridiales bacterium]|nr:ABC-2 family transporter protein [Clostridiales bacterium]
MRRNLRFIWILFKLKLSHLMVFRLSFFGAFFADGILFLIQLLVFSAIYGNVDMIGNWNQAQMIIFIGTFSLINAISMVLAFFGINQLPNKIKSGALDHYLTKPISPLLRLSFESIDLGSIPLIVLAMVLIAYGISISGIILTFTSVAGYIVLVILMTILWYDVELIIRTIPFFVVSGTAITRVEELLELCFRVPGILFKGVYKIVFYFILPYGIMATVPTQFISNTITTWELAYGVGIVLLFTVFTIWLWRFGVSHYKSASS